MADVADEEKTGVKMEQETKTGDIIKSDAAEVGDVPAKTEVKVESADVKDEATTESTANGTSVAADSDKREDVNEKKDTNAKEDDNEKDAGEDHKRKDGPGSESHDRHDRKRSRGGHQHNPRRTTNIKSTFDELPESSDPDEIRRQVEFYFSDSNLPIDAYLLAQTGGHRNYPVELKTIHNFKRMRHFQPFSAVRDAVKQSKFLNLDDNDEITRKTPLDEKFGDDAIANRTAVHDSSMARSIYAKGFGDEIKNTHLDIEAFFAPYGPVNGIRLRRSANGEFKGSVFVEFVDEGTQQAFLALESKPKWNGTEELKIMSKKEYVEMKHDGILEGNVRPKSPTRQGYGEKSWRGGDRGRGRGGRGRGRGQHFDKRDGRSKDGRGNGGKDDWKTRRDRDQEEDRRNERGRRQGGRSRDHDSRRRDDEDDERSEDDRPRRKSKTNHVDKPEAKTNGKGVDDGIDAVKSKKRDRQGDAADDIQGGAKKVKASDES